MSFAVRLTHEAEHDLERLFDVVLERELARDNGDFELPEAAIGAIRASLASLSHSPFTCRKAGASPFLRELLIPFGLTGCVALFEIVNNATVVIAAVRHQREDDYH